MLANTALAELSFIAFTTGEHFANVVSFSARITWAERNRANVTRDEPRAVVNGRAQTWRERLNRAAFAARSRVTFLSADLAALRDLRERAVRCAVYQENAGITGRATFNVN